MAEMKKSEEKVTVTEEAAKAGVKVSEKAVETKADREAPAAVTKTAKKAAAAPKKAEAKKETVKKETAKRTAAAKKAAAKEEIAPAAEAAPAEKAKTAKAPARRTAKKAPEVKGNVTVQFSGKSYSTEDLVKIAKDVWKYDLGREEADFKSVELYVKPEESSVYYVVNEEVKGNFSI